LTTILPRVVERAAFFAHGLVHRRDELPLHSASSSGDSDRRSMSGPDLGRNRIDGGAATIVPTLNVVLGCAGHDPREFAIAFPSANAGLTAERAVAVATRAGERHAPSTASTALSTMWWPSPSPSIEMNI
jgi:hypothetical protein